jgi:peptide/nickel transport system ATP-binding protein
MNAIDVSGLRVDTTGGGGDIVADVAFSVASGEVVGLVGESGSGKTTVALALLGHARRGTRISHGSIRVAGEEILEGAKARVQALRGNVIAYVPQDPAAALNPALTIGTQLTEVIAAHRREMSAAETRGRVAETLAEVKLPSASAFLRRYPHQISGGQQQRVCIAMAFLLRPRAIVLDEPTTGLDVTTQAHVLGTVKELCANHDVGAVYVSHDLAVVAGLADRVLVMYAGRVVESGTAAQLFASPGHPYTRRLLEAIPDISTRRALVSIPGHVPAPGRRPTGCVFAPRCPDALDACRDGEPASVEVEHGHEVACIRTREATAAVAGLVLDDRVGRSAQPGDAPLLEAAGICVSHGRRQVLFDASVELEAGECVALVGESGSGKTTFARAIMGLHLPSAGEVRVRGEVVAAGVRDRGPEVRRSLQYVFQSPYNSLNPRQTIGQIVSVPIEHFFGLRGNRSAERVASALERVALPASIARAYPDELSGGERQRVAIARALASEPDMLVCDEITSALDVSVQAAIIELLTELRERDKLALLFVTHNLALVRTIADRVLVLDQGRIVESGVTREVIDHPTTSYTRALIADTPTLAGAWRNGSGGGLVATS